MKALRILLSMCVVAVAGSAQADWGAQDTAYTWVSPEEFRALDSTTGFGTEVPSFYLTPVLGGNGVFIAHLKLDNGVLIQSIRFYYEDSSATAGLSFGLAKAQTDVDAGTNPGATAIFSTPDTIAATPGYTTVDVPVNQTYLNTENGKDNRWIIRVSFLGTDRANPFAFGGARVAWKRQITPGPATATFIDVPTTHPFFAPIEALVKSGITTGCAGPPPQYCPDQPVTRGQMAVFLARALGLHWVP